MIPYYLISLTLSIVTEVVWKTPPFIEYNSLLYSRCMSALQVLSYSFITPTIERKIPPYNPLFPLDFSLPPSWLLFILSLTLPGRGLGWGWIHSKILFSQKLLPSGGRKNTWVRVRVFFCFFVIPEWFYHPLFVTPECFLSPFVRHPGNLQAGV